MRKSTILLVLCGVLLFAACSITNGTRTITQKSYTNPFDSTAVVETKETWEEKTIWPWQIAIGVVGGIGVLVWAAQGAK